MSIVTAVAGARSIASDENLRFNNGSPPVIANITNKLNRASAAKDRIKTIVAALDSAIDFRLREALQNLVTE